MEIWSTENVGPGPIFFQKIGSDWTDIFEKIGPTLKMDPDLYYFLALYRIMHKGNKITLTYGAWAITFFKSHNNFA